MPKVLGLLDCRILMKKEIIGIKAMYKELDFKYLPLGYYMIYDNDNDLEFKPCKLHDFYYKKVEWFYEEQ